MDGILIAIRQEPRRHDLIDNLDVDDAMTYTVTLRSHWTRFIISRSELTL